MFGAWVILLWFLVVVAFLVKLAPTRRVVSAMRQQPLLVQTVAVLILCLAVINGSTKTNSQNSAVSPTNNSSFRTSPSSVILSPSSLSSSLPAWWQGSDTDTDDDGIPDQWEKWTHGNRLVADADIDRDADGLTELEEFQNQTDPRTADTDADGFTDRFEIDNGMNPLTKANFIPNEPDINADGIIDLWEGTSYSYGFNDTDHDGFDDSYEAQSLPDATAENFEVLVNVLTTRSALLTWNNTEGSGGLIILPTTGTVVRLRLPFSADTELALSPSPEGATAPSGELWKSRLRLTFAPRSGQTTRGGVIIAANGDISQKIIEKESTIICFSESSTGQRQTLAQTTTDDTDLKIQIYRRRFAITPELDYFHTTGESVGPFSITNAVNISTTNFLWRASHGSMMPLTGSSSTLIVTRMPEQDEPITVTAALELEAGVTNEVSAVARLCPRSSFALLSGPNNFSPQLFETNAISVTLPGCTHHNDPGWIEVEIVREVIGATQHVAYVDIDPSTSALDQYVNVESLPPAPIFFWDGRAQVTLPLADHPDVFSEGKTPFHRAMPEIRDGVPVPPPFYTQIVTLYGQDKTTVLHQATRKVFIPQIVTVYWQTEAITAYRTPMKYFFEGGDSTVIYPGYQGETTELFQKLVDYAQQFIPADVNLRFAVALMEEPSLRSYYVKRAVVKPDEVSKVDVNNIKWFTLGETGTIPRNERVGIEIDCYVGSILGSWKEDYKMFAKNLAKSEILQYQEMFDITNSPDTLLLAVGHTLAHETGHTVGLVHGSYMVNGPEYHNPEQDPDLMMNRTTKPFQRLRDSPPTWKLLNHNYLKFILPTH